MEPVENYDPEYYKRLESLSLAVQFTKERMSFTGSDAVQLAEFFLKYLNGENNG